jgi:hypothetical protein
MTFLEKEHPEWVCYFAVALFVGVRPDMTHGEMAKLAAKVGEHGTSRYYRRGKFHFTAGITRTGAPAARPCS